MKKNGILGLVLAGAVVAQAGLVNVNYLTGFATGDSAFTNTYATGFAGVTAEVTMDTAKRADGVSSRFNNANGNGLAVVGDLNGDYSNNAWFDAGESFQLTFNRAFRQVVSPCDFFTFRIM